MGEPRIGYVIGRLDRALRRAVGDMENAMLADLDDAGREQLLEALVNCVHRLGAGFGSRS